MIDEPLDIGRLMKLLPPSAIACIAGTAVWGLLIVAAVMLEATLNTAGPERMAPIPGFLLIAIFTGWIPAMAVGWWMFRSR